LKNRKIVVVALIAISVIVVSLIAQIGTSSAQCQGTDCTNQGQGRGGMRGNGMGMGMMQNGMHNGTMMQNGMGNGAMMQNGMGMHNGMGMMQNGMGNGAMMQNGMGMMQNGMGMMNGDCQYCLDNLPAAVPGEVPADVVDALVAGLTDEYNAYNTYQAIIDQFGTVRPFTAIQMSEAHHIEMLEFLFDRYSLDVPEVAPLADAPQFATLADACAAAVDIETANFELYDQWLTTVQNYPDMVHIFTMLRNASEMHHMPALEGCAG
jgi:hypothetical protein